MHKNIVLRFSKAYFILSFFLIIIVFGQFRIENRQGTILVITELVCSLLLVTEKDYDKIKFNRVCWIYICFIFYRLLCLLLVLTGKEDEIKSLIVKEIGIFFLFILILNKVSEISFIKWMRNLGTVMGILGCFEYFTKASIFSGFISVESRVIMQNALGTSGARVRLMFIHPIICAIYFVFFLLCLFYVPYHNNKLNLLSGICLILSLAGTQSRSSWISFFIVSFLFIVSEKRFRFRKLNRNKMITTILIILILILVYGVLEENLREMFMPLYERWMAGLNSENSANYNRVSMIKMGVKIWLNANWKNKIIGLGDGYALDYLKAHAIRGWSVSVDNQYITLLVDYGIMGFGFAVGILMYSVINLFCAKERIQRCGCAMLIALWISAFFYEMLTWTYAMILVCIAILLTRTVNSESGIKSDM